LEEGPGGEREKEEEKEKKTGFQLRRGKAPREEG